MGKTNKQLSLLDLKSKDKITPRYIQDWQLFRKARQEIQIQEFEKNYGENPVFWKRFHNKGIDLFFTFPDNAAIVDLNSGELQNRAYLLEIAWKMDVNQLTLERRRHLSSQLTSLLDGKLSSSNWKKEIMDFIHFVPEYRQALVDLLSEYPVNFCFEKEEHKNMLRIFGDPSELEKFFKQGLEKDLLKI